MIEFLKLMLRLYQSVVKCFISLSKLRLEVNNVTKASSQDKRMIAFKLYSVKKC